MTILMDDIVVGEAGQRTDGSKLTQERKKEVSVSSPDRVVQFEFALPHSRIPFNPHYNSPFTNPLSLTLTEVPTEIHRGVQWA